MPYESKIVLFCNYSCFIRYKFIRWVQKRCFCAEPRVVPVYMVVPPVDIGYIIFLTKKLKKTKQ